MTTKQQLKKHKTKYCLLTACKFIVMIVPLVIVFCINHDTYFTRANSWKLSIGCIVGLGLALLLVTGEEQIKKYLKGVWLFVIIFILSWCFESIMQDIVLLSLCALIGKITTLFFNPYLHNLSHKISLMKDTLITEEVKKEIRNG